MAHESWQCKATLGEKREKKLTVTRNSHSSEKKISGKKKIGCSSLYILQDQEKKGVNTKEGRG